MSTDERRDVRLGGRALGVTAAALREAIRAGQVGAWRWDVKSDVLAWSRNMEAIHRLNEGAFDGTFRTFAENLHPEDRQRVLKAVREALVEGERFTVQYRLPPAPLGGTRWLEARGLVIRNAAGEPLSMTGVCQEITPYKEAEAELALRARQQEAMAQLGEQALAGASLDAIFTAAAKQVCRHVEADYAEILELSADRNALTLRAGQGWLEDETGATVATSAADTQIGAALRSSRPVVVSDYSTEERFSQPERLQRHGVQSGASITIPGTEGNPFGVIAVYCQRIRCISETDLRFLQSVANVLGSAIRSAQDQERKELLIGELRHRVGNLFSLVQALHRQTGQNAADAHDLEMKFGSRLASLASAHAMILDGGWQKTSLRALLETTLAPYIERVTYTGSDVRLPADAAFSFSMALHELATNANKYGALSNAKGRLEIDCRSEPDALGEKLVLVWNEHDGPPPAGSETEGFGSKLISQVVERQLGGRVTRVVQPDGLKFTIKFPIG